ncbi:MAG: ABC transporter permease [Gemmatimonadota bacterium]|nr:ABC transporter permease [Gemmatimonadota bacterium]
MSGRKPHPTPLANEDEGSARDIDEELTFHIEGRAREWMASGVPRDEAFRRARAAFGDLERIRTEMRAVDAESRRLRGRRDRLRDLLRDVRLASRRLVGQPAHSAVAIGTLALGIGASVAMFTVLDAVVLRPLPWPAPDRLVQLWPRLNHNITLSRLVGDGVPSVEAYTGLSRWGLTWTGGDEARVLDALAVDAGYFDVFGAQVERGRSFTRADTDPDRSDVVIVSHAFWASRLGSDPDVIGRRLQLDGYLHPTRTIVGVMDAGHRPLGRAADVWVPLHVPPGRDFASDSTWYVNSVVARMRPDASVDQADAEVRAAARRIADLWPGRLDAETVQRAGAVGILTAVIGDVRGTLWTLLGAVGLVLLIACANVANLLLARAASRQGDRAIRAALGATRARLLREHLIESALLAGVACAAGAALAQVALRLLALPESSGLPRLDGAGPSVDMRALGFAVTTSAACVLVFGLLPALRASDLERTPNLREGGRARTRGPALHRANRMLLAGEVALAMVLVTGAGLMVSSFVALRAVEPGLDASDVLSVRIVPAEDRFAADRALGLWKDLEARVAALPGVSGVGSIQLEPFTDGNWGFPYLAEGHAPPADGPLPVANFRVVTPGYFEAVDLPVRAGRALTDADRAGTAGAMVINARMAERLWPDSDPVGREIRLFGDVSYRVVGVVGDVHQHALDRDPEPEMYVAHAQYGTPGPLVSMALMVETDDPARLTGPVRDVVRQIDPDIPVPSLRPLTEALDASMSRRRFYALLLAGFGGLALLLGGLGVYGVMSYLVGARLPDFGVRLALGAAPADVRREALRSGLVPTAWGLALGTLLALASTRLLRAALYGVSPLHLPTYVTVATVLVGVASLACWAPARRAARVDPVRVLGAE